jgi:putative membrane protein
VKGEPSPPPSGPESTETPRARRYSRFLPKAPRLPLAFGYIAGLAGVEGVLAFWGLGLRDVLYGTGAVLLAPALLAVFMTPGLSAALGGRFSLRRSALLSILALGLGLPFYAIWRVTLLVAPAGSLPSVVWVVLLAQGAAVWFRHMSLFGMSRPDHGRTLPSSVIQPVIAIVLLFAYFPPSVPEIAGAIAILGIGFVSSVELLVMADRPLRREFGISGVALIRPLLEHVSTRDPAATRQLEGFFGRKAIEADVKVTLIAFNAGTRRIATLALPTVHPGPFAALGASDLPRKVAAALGPEAGTVFVPHTPCNHDLDLPATDQLDRVLHATRELAKNLAPSERSRVSELYTPPTGSFVRAQVLGDAVLAIITQAPATSDDIDYAIIAPYYDRSFAGEQPVVAFIDGHNSYYNNTGDITFGSPAHGRLDRDLPAAIEGALRASREGPLRVGAAAKVGYTVAKHGIGPEGIRALVVEGGGRRTAYVVVDGNNMLIGLRAKILASLADKVDAAEVMTTDNHVVHEVDGSVNTVGERFSAEELIRDIGAVVDAARQDLVEVTVSAGRTKVAAVRVLGPGFTARLLTSLGDTITVFANSAVVTFLLMVSSALVVVALLR